MEYIVPSSIISMIQSIPSFKTDVAKIKNVRSVKQIFGIGEDEKILSYRVVPKLFAKLETGGTIFTDKGVYCKLPSGYLSSDYLTMGIHYNEMIKYIPALGYTADRQPELIGEWSNQDNLSFWLTPIVGTESNEAIVNVFDAIIEDITSSDISLFDMHHTILQSFLEEEEAHFFESGKIEANVDKVLRYHIERGRFDVEQYIAALILVFRNEMRKKNYENGVQYVLDEGMSLNLYGFDAKLENAMRDEALFIGTPDNRTSVGALELFCKTVPNLSLELFPNIYAFYSQNSLYSELDEFIEKMESTTEYESIQQELQNTLLSHIQDLSDEKQSKELTPNDLAFLLYSAKKPYSSFIASQLLIDHHCACLLFEEANSVIEEFNKGSQDVEKVKALKDQLEKSKIEYARVRFDQAEEYMKLDDVENALENYKIAVELYPFNHLYYLNYIYAILEHKDFLLAHETIGKMRAHHFQLDSETEEMLQTMMIRCVEGLTEAIRPFYEQLLNDDYDSIYSDDSVYQVKDQFGLSLLYYAILLKKYKAFRYYSKDQIESEMSVSGFDIRCFASKDRTYRTTMMLLLVHFDDEMNRIIEEQESTEAKKKASIAQMEFASNIIIALGGYAPDLDIGSQEASDAIERSKVEMEDSMKKLARDKVDEYAIVRDNSVDFSNLQSAMIYLLIIDPSFIEHLFNDDKTQFKLIQSDSGFWYLPTVFVDKASSMMMSAMPSLSESSDSNNTSRDKATKSPIVMQSNEDVAVQETKSVTRNGKAYRIKLKTNSKSVNHKRNRRN